MVRLLVAGDVGLFTYAGHVGAHIRPLDDSPAPQSPHGSEFSSSAWPAARGCALRTRFGAWSAVVGPEIFGATVLRSFFGGTGTAVEELLTTRFEGTTKAPGSCCG